MTAEQLFYNYELIDRKKNFEVIDFCEKNLPTIQNLDELDDNRLTLKRNLLSDYGYALAQGGQSSKAIPVLTEAIRLHEKHPSFEENRSKLNGYQYIVFLLGESFYKADKIDESRAIFEKLIKFAPDNESYKSWIIQTTNYKRGKISRVVFITFVFWLLMSVIFRDIASKSFDWTFRLTGLALFVTWATIEVKNYVVRKRYR